MNAIELFQKDGKQTGAFYCEKCRLIYQSSERANQCCNNYHCNYCGKDTGSRFRLICDPCQELKFENKEKERFEKSEKLTSYDGWVYSEGHGYKDGYFESLEDFYDWASELDENDWPEYVWTCTPNYFVQADIQDISQQICDNSHEDFDFDDLDGIQELEKALDQFNEKNNSVCSYEVNYKQSVLVKKPEK